MTRRVRIRRDTTSPLWFVACVAPCQPGGWCMTGEAVGYPALPGLPGCFLGSSATEAGAARMAKASGWEVVA